VAPWKRAALLIHARAEHFDRRRTRATIQILYAFAMMAAGCAGQTYCAACAIAGKNNPSESMNDADVT